MSIRFDKSEYCPRFFLLSRKGADGTEQKKKDSMSLLTLLSSHYAKEGVCKAGGAFILSSATS